MAVATLVLWLMAGFAGCVTISIIAYAVVQLLAGRGLVSRVRELELAVEDLSEALTKRQKRDAQQARRDAVAHPSPSIDEDEADGVSARSRGGSADDLAAKRAAIFRALRARGKG